jgi:chitin disaccharide deacetylase
MNRPFILCADDYGLSPAVSRGIVEALARGRLSATSMLTTGADLPAAAGALQPYKRSVDIGLHLNLTVGSPLGRMPAFAPSGRFSGLQPLLFGCARHGLPEGEIRAEIGRQIEAFQAAMGQPPDFVDGHQHIHVLPGIRGWLMEDLNRRGFARRVWLRNSADLLWKIVARRTSAAKACFVACLAVSFATMARSRGFSVNAGFAGFSGFDPASDYGDDFATYLKFPGPRHLIMCHPGRVEAAMDRDRVTVPRDRELAFFLSDRFAAMLRAGNFIIARFGDIDRQNT